MFPGFASHDIANVWLTNPEFDGESSLSFASDKAFADLQYRLSRQFCCVRAFPFTHIGHVPMMVSGIKMTDVEAKRIVASVEDMKLSGVPVSDDPHIARCMHLSATRQCDVRAVGPSLFDTFVRVDSSAILQEGPPLPVCSGHPIIIHSLL